MFSFVSPLESVEIGHEGNLLPSKNSKPASVTRIVRGDNFCWFPLLQTNYCPPYKNGAGAQSRLSWLRGVP